MGYDLLNMWWHGRKEPLDPKLIPEAIDMAGYPATSNSHGLDYQWLEVLKLLIPLRPAEVAKLLTERITDARGGMFWSGGDPVVEVMAAVSARDPTGTMEAVGSALLDPARRPMFGVAIFRGLFEAIGLQVVSDWVAKYGDENIKWIARHLKSPYLGQDGEVVVPPLTKWFFEEHEDDQRAFEWFLMGGSNGVRTWTGDDAGNEESDAALR